MSNRPVIVSVWLVLAAACADVVTFVSAQNGPGYIMDVGPHGQTRAAPLQPGERLHVQADGTLRDWRGHRVVLDRTEIDPRTGKPLRTYADGTGPLSSGLGDAEDERAQLLVSRAEIERRRIQREERDEEQARNWAAAEQTGDAASQEARQRAQDRADYRAMQEQMRVARGGGPRVCDNVGRCVKESFCRAQNGMVFERYETGGPRCKEPLICCALNMQKIRTAAAAKRQADRANRAARAAGASAAATTPATAPNTPAPHRSARTGPKGDVRLCGNMSGQCVSDKFCKKWGGASGGKRDCKGALVCCGLSQANWAKARQAKANAKANANAKSGGRF